MITPDQLPAPSAITHAKIRESVEQRDAARAAHGEARKSHVHGEQVLIPEAQQRAAVAEADGELEPLAHVAEAEQQLARLAHAERVALVRLDRAEQQLADTCDRHGDEYSAEARKTRATTLARWHKATAALPGLYASLAQATRVESGLGGDAPGVGGISLGLRQLGGIEIPPGGPKVAHVAVEDILQELASVGDAAPVEPERPKAQPMQIMGSPNVGQAGVDGEIAERQDFMRRMRERQDAA